MEKFSPSMEVDSRALGRAVAVAKNGRASSYVVIWPRGRGYLNLNLLQVPRTRINYQEERRRIL